MKVPRKALCILIVGFGVSAPALAQSGGARLGPASGGGLTLPETALPGPGRSDVGLQLGATQPGWWSVTGTERRLELGVSVAPRLGLRVPSARDSAEPPSPSGFDVGPGLRWRSAAGTLSASYRLDPTGLARGESVQFSFSRPVISAQGFRMLAFVGAQWQSPRGDRAVVATAGEGWGQPVSVRPRYSANTATNVGFGLDSYYQLTKSSSIMVGASGLRLGGAAAEGALYTNRWQAILYGGYAFRF